MRKIAYFDAQFGAAGDMLVASLLSAGLDQNAWQAEVSKLALPKDSYRIVISDVFRCTIKCKKLDVTNLAGEPLDPVYDESAHEHEHFHADEQGGYWHSHEQERHGEHHHHHEPQHAHVHHGRHKHDHEHHEHQHSADHGRDTRVPEMHAHRHEHDHDHRRLSDVVQILENSPISARAKQLAVNIFSRLARAEGKVHGVPSEEVVFHEVGAIDAIVDIAGFCIGLDMIGITDCYVSPLPLGRARVKTQHGLFPAPGPATIYLLSDAEAPTTEALMEFESLTPTGAAILCEIVTAWDKYPPFSKLLGAGYGAGTKNPPGWPNVCRVVIGEAPDAILSETKYDTDVVAIIEANLDDYSPQALSYAVERFYEEGALDVTIVPAVMKKGRSGHLVSLICRPEDRFKMQELVLAETSSIGVRWHLAERLVATREWQDVQLSRGESVRIKIARNRQGVIVNAQPEFEDCATYARKHNIPIKEVMQEAIACFCQP